MKKLKSQKGITLVALVITIIILIILAGISLSIVFGQDGLINRAKTGAQQYNEEATREQGQLESINTFLETLDLGSTTPTDTPPAPVDPNVTAEQAQSNDMLSRTINSKYTDSSYTGTNKTVTIPAGYKMTADATKIEDGIVITDAAENGNEWVWIPVNEAIADTIEATELGGTGNGAGVTTTLKSKSEILSGKTRKDIGATSGYREPDIVTSYDETANEATYISDAGFTTFGAFVTDLSTNYKNMIESIEEFGGFYVGRYEITGTLASPTEKPGWAITGGSTDANDPGKQSASWYKLYNACTIFTTSSATSRMMWGCTWDEICKYIGNKGYTDANSANFGNYKDNVVTANDGTTELTVAGTGSKLQTGVTTFTKTCNIYDLAGNCYEWTQEAFNAGYRAMRGRWLRQYKLKRPCFFPRLQLS